MYLKSYLDFVSIYIYAILIFVKRLLFNQLNYFGKFNHYGQDLNFRKFALYIQDRLNLSFSLFLL